MHLFNKFLILANSICTRDSCGNLYNNSFYFSTLMIIGYPNNSDSNFDLINYLKKNYNHSIDSIILDLSKNLIIDNNIFGYKYDGIQIQNILKNGSIYLNSFELDKEIEINETLNKSEIKIKFKDNIYNISSYKLEYSYIVTEPEYEEYEKYSKYTDNINNYTKEYFNCQKQKYIGKTIYFNIYLNEDLTINYSNINCSYYFTKNLTCITNEPYDEIITIPETIEIITNENIIFSQRITNNINKGKLSIPETTEIITNENSIFSQQIINNISQGITSMTETSEIITKENTIFSQQIKGNINQVLTSIPETTEIIDKENNKLSQQITNNLNQEITYIPETTEIMTKENIIFTQQIANNINNETNNTILNI